MDEFKELIFNWLIELDDKEAANFLSNCEIEQNYIDTLFSTDSDVETYMYEVLVSVPLKIHSKISEYKNEVLAIESAIVEAGQSNGFHVNNIIWRPYLKNEHKIYLDQKGEKIIQLLNQEYVNKQIRLMNNAIESNSHLALGISKELIETCCKHILNKAKVEVNKDWDIARLVKETNKQINLMPFQVENIELAKSSIAKILGGLSNIVHGITELRNSYGTGHGHSPEFKTIDMIYIKLVVSASSELAIFYLSIEKFNTEKDSN